MVANIGYDVDGIRSDLVAWPSEMRAVIQLLVFVAGAASALLIVQTFPGWRDAFPVSVPVFVLALLILAASAVTYALLAAAWNAYATAKHRQFWKTHSQLRPEMAGVLEIDAAKMSERDRDALHADLIEWGTHQASGGSEGEVDRVVGLIEVERAHQLEQTKGASADTPNESANPRTTS